MHENVYALYVSLWLKIYAQQLAGATLVCGNNTDRLSFVSLDDRLDIAAQQEGLTTSR